MSKYEVSFHGSVCLKVENDWHYVLLVEAAATARTGATAKKAMVETFIVDAWLNRRDGDVM